MGDNIDNLPIWNHLLVIEASLKITSTISMMQDKSRSALGDMIDGAPASRSNGAIPMPRKERDLSDAKCKRRLGY
jgi:hypothetical protein